jgi:hypothetical protein
VFIYSDLNFLRASEAILSVGKLESGIIGKFKLLDAEKSINKQLVIQVFLS